MKGKTMITWFKQIGELFRKPNHESPLEIEPLYAVWEYDLFPRYVCGEVEKIYEDGTVSVKGYAGLRLKPVTLLPAFRGRQVESYIYRARQVYNDALHNAVYASAGERLEEMGVPGAKSRLFKSGMQFSEMQKLFDQAVGDFNSKQASR